MWCTGGQGHAAGAGRNGGVLAVLVLRVNHHHVTVVDSVAGVCTVLTTEDSVVMTRRKNQTSESGDIDAEKDSIVQQR